MTIFQGEIYWIDVGKPHGSEPAYLCPCVVVRNDALNREKIKLIIQGIKLVIEPQELE